MATLDAIAFHVPSTVLTDDQLAKEIPGWDPLRAAKKIGIRCRHIARAGECSSDLAFEAASALLQVTGVSRLEVDSLIFCTQSPDYFLPATACSLQQRLGLSTSCAAFDINQGCSGYVYGLALANALVESGMSRVVLLLTGETYSKFIGAEDRTNRPIFGDAGSASLITCGGRGAHIGPFVLGTDGQGFHDLIVPAGGMRIPRNSETSKTVEGPDGVARSLENLYMNGPGIFTFALQRVPELVGTLLAKARLSMDHVNWYVFHQANAFMNEALRAKIGIPAEKYPACMQEYGNTVSSTLPIVLCETGSAYGRGDRVMLVGFGVGYSWGACLLDWGDVRLLRTNP